MVFIIISVCLGGEDGRWGGGAGERGGCYSVCLLMGYKQWHASEGGIEGGGEGAHLAVVVLNK